MGEIIHPADIESELDRIWESFQGPNKMRASLFNLIIYTKKGQRYSYLKLVAKKIIEKFPSRIILITYDRYCKEHEIHTSASILTTNEGENEIACDLIEMDVCAKHHSRIPFILLPHISPDLPIYLVYANDPAQDNSTALELEKFADRVIFDSESASDLPAFARALLKHQRHSHTDIADLNWARTEEWRQLLTNVFRSPEDLAQLERATKISIHYNSRQTNYLHHTNIQSIYIQAWVAIQLNWEFTHLLKEGAVQIFSYKGEEGRVVRNSLHPVRVNTLPSGRILSIQIETMCAHHYYLCRSSASPHHVIIKKSSPKYCALPVHYVLERDKSGESLVKEVCHKGTSTHYINVLNMLKAMDQKELSTP